MNAFDGLRFSETKLSIATVNSLARLAMRDWPQPSGIGFWGGKACELWQLLRACDAVRSGAITGQLVSSKFGPKFELIGTMRQPIVPEHLLAIWRDETAAQAAYLAPTEGRPE